MKPTKEKSELVSNLHQNGDKDTLKMVAKIVQWTIDDLREQNDESPTSEVLGNQGALRKLKELVRLLSGIDIATVVKG